MKTGNYSFEHKENRDGLMCYDEIKVQTDKSTLFKVGDQEIWLPIDYINIDFEEKEVNMPKWLYDKHFI